MAPKREGAALTKEMGLVDGIAFVVGAIIGSGIFITPGVVLAHSGSAGASILCWLLGMLIAIGGALCYIEVGLLFPKTGGEYVYLHEAYSFKKKNDALEFLGSLLAFLYTWASGLIRPAGAAVITLTSAKYLSKPFFVDSNIPSFQLKAVSLILIGIITAILCRSMKVTAKLQTFLSFLKIFSCLFIIFTGIWHIIKTKQVPDNVHSPFAGSHLSKPEDFGSLSLALYASLFAYDGWYTHIYSFHVLVPYCCMLTGVLLSRSNLNYAIEEQKNAEQNLPRSLLIGIPVVAVCYVLVNLAYFSALPYHQISGPHAVALTFGEVVLGNAGLVIIPLIVAVAGFGAGLANIYTSSRLVFAAARGGQLPEVLCGIHRDWHTPVMAILFQCTLACLLVLIGDIEDLIDASSTALWIFYGSVFLGLLILRKTHSTQHRPFKVWLSLPVVMLAVAVLLVILPVLVKPGPSLAALAMISLGVPVYVCLVMTSPWKLRPTILDQWSGDFSSYINSKFNLETSRELVEKS